MYSIVSGFLLTGACAIMLIDCLLVTGYIAYILTWYHDMRLVIYYPDVPR